MKKFIVFPYRDPSFEVCAESWRRTGPTIEFSARGKITQRVRAEDVAKVIQRPSLRKVVH